MSKSPEKKVSTEKTKAQTENKKPVLTPLQSIKNDILVIEKAYDNNDFIYIKKFLKKVRSYKKKLNSFQVQQVFKAIFPKEENAFFSSYKDYQSSEETFELAENKANKLSGLKEVQIYVKTLVLIHLIKLNDIQRSQKVADNLVQEILDINRRHFDEIAAIVYFFYARVYEVLGKSKDIREKLFDIYTFTCVKKDEIGQSTLLNLLLRNFIQTKNYESALNLISKTNFPEGKNHNELVRYLFYTG